MKQSLFAFLLALFLLTNLEQLSAQEFEKGRLRLTVLDPSAIPVIRNADGQTLIRVQDADLQSIFTQFNVKEFKLAFPYSATRIPALQNAYEIVCDCDENALMQTLQNETSEYYTQIRKIPVVKFLGGCTSGTYTCTPTLGCSLPNDDLGYYYYCRTEAFDAWCITQGDPSVKIAIIDAGFDANAPDLVNQVDNAYSGPKATHGTQSASIAAAEANNNVGLAGIANGCRLLLYEAKFFPGNITQAVLDGAKVINMSFMTDCNYIDPATQLIIDDAYNAGVVLVASAGNGADYYCPSAEDYAYPASNDHVISVSSTNIDDNHLHPLPSSYYVVNHNYNDKVDIVAPGYDIFGGSGTSIAAPIVAGAAALVLSVNPTLTPDQVEEILKCTADDIYGCNEAFIGKLGAGRLNIFKAVQLAQDFNASLTANIQVTSPAACNGSDGTITINMTGGNPSYSYSLNGGSPQTSNVFSGLAAGRYRIMVEDANGDKRCFSTEILPSSSHPSVTLVSNGPLCLPNGFIDITVSGGSGSYSYSWSQDGSTVLATTQDLTLTNISPDPSNPDLTAIYMPYTVTVTDNGNGCTTTFSTPLQQHASSWIDVVYPVPDLANGVIKEEICPGTSTGCIQIEAAWILDGKPTFSYVWSDGDINEDRSNLPAGSYEVTATDKYGCTKNLYWSQNGISSITVADGTPLSLTVSTTDEVCGDDGTATVTVTGGNGSPDFLWSTAPVQQTQTAIRLAAGTYTVTVTDFNDCSPGCTATAIATISNTFDIAGGCTIGTAPCTNTTWNTNMKVKGQVIVPNGQTLTINNGATIQFAANSGIVVEPRGKLIADGATLTNVSGCSELWKGIELQGQYDYGTVRIDNSVIENAAVGVWSNFTGRINGSVFDVLGYDIVIDNNSVFRNNQVGVLTGLRSGPGAGGGLDGGLTVIQNSTFELTDALSSSLSHPVEFVKTGTNERNGVKIDQTLFQNISSISGNPLSGNERPHGIVDAGEATLQLNGCSFDNLSVGIDSRRYIILSASTFQNSSVGVQRLNIDGSQGKITGNIFNNVETGIYLQACSRSEIISANIFTIPSATNNTNNDNYGIFAVGCDGLTITDNKFDGSFSSSLFASYAMGFENTGTARSAVFRNEMGGMDYGVQTQDLNPALKLRCNTFSEVNNVAKPIQNYSWFSVDGSLADQGKPSCDVVDFDAAGNHWKENCPGAERDIKSNISFTYYAHQRDLGQGTTTIPCSSSPITVHQCTQDEQPTSCDPSHIGGGIIDPGGTGEDCDKVISEVIEMLKERRGRTDELRRQHEDLLRRTDGGNTQVLIALINKIPAVSAVELKNRLLNSFPLSDDAMTALLNRQQPLPPNDLREVLVSNRRLSDAILQLLESKRPALPDKTLKEIKDAQTMPPLFPKAKDLETEIIFHEQEGELLLNGLLTALIKCGQHGRIRDVLHEHPTIEAKRKLAEFEFAEGNFAEAREAVALVRQMTEDAVNTQKVANTLPEDNHHFCKMMDCLINVAEQGRTVKEMNASEIQTMREVANARLPISARAELVITKATGEVFVHHFKKEGATSAKSLESVKAEKEIKNNKPDEIVKVHPNPTSNILNIQVTLEKNENAILNIYDLLGRQLRKLSFINESKEIQIAMNDWQSGIYIYNFSTNSGKTKQGKITLLK